MADKYISREAALMKLMQDGCSAKNLQSMLLTQEISNLAMW